MTPNEIFELGEQTIAQNTGEIAKIGLRLYGTSEIQQIITRMKADPANRFQSKEELLDYSKRLMNDARDQSRHLVLQLPSQPVIIQLLPSYQQTAGVPPHYEANSNPANPGTFWISLKDWKTETRGSAWITVVHETWPGHHLQIALARALKVPPALSRIAFNSAYSEGWANYAERLAEESGIDVIDGARIQRRLILGRGLVLDPGIHAFGWTRERAVRFVMEAGLDREASEDTIDRVSVEPGQLTAYEVGGFEILRLREHARTVLGAGFKLQEFHQQILENGPLPLDVLRERWQPGQ
jgi:uncharacterized protein (DUF885 family)